MAIERVVYRSSRSNCPVMDFDGNIIDDEFSHWPSISHRWFSYAKTALNHYEKEHLVGIYPYTYVCWILVPEIDERAGSWIHISFIAIRKGGDFNDMASRKLFFAELVCYNAMETKVTHCCVLQPNDPGITNSCGICDPDEIIPHPSTGYLVGHWPYQNAIEGDSPPKLFFAELYKIEPAETYSLSKCCMLEPGDPGISYECGFCDPRKKIAHAPDYLAGRWIYQHPRELDF